ncbi:MAG: TOBE domain-containing protein [bacterium]
MEIGNGSTLTLKTPDGFEIKALYTNSNYPEKAIAMVRPEKILITLSQPKGENINILYGEIENIVYLGTVVQFIMDMNGRKIVVLDKNQYKKLKFSVKQKVFASWDVSSTVLMPQ